MSTVGPGWYRDPADPSTQRYWDGEGWLGDPIPADAAPPAQPPQPVTHPGVSQAQGSTGDSGVTIITAPTPEALTPTLGTQPGPAQPPNTSAPGPDAPGPPLPPGIWLTPGATVMPHGMALASPGTRLLARMIDVLLVLLLCTIANFWFAYQWWQMMAPYFAEAYRRGMAGNTSTAGLDPPTQAGTLLFLIILVTTAVWFAYEVPSSANSGQTPGKRLFGIKVVRLESTDQLGFGRSFRRWGRLGLPTLLWYCYGIGFVVQAIDCLFVAIDRPLRQAIHDKVAATVVVRVRRPSRPDPPQLASPQRLGAPRGGRHADPR